ncbi:MAG: Stalked cell differentiation-controlling protein [Candidatus Accumulibacter regalis]|jgi:diguanylate cyclase (GGDEF)-like protein|uniref:Stalked cell differentiation-controlling protein n=1 Tax=Accumulibacter regalis TaxID=522306 RepID=A0A011QGW9_ACCRE|nr:MULTISPECIES: GGDEF domain-containing protein [unclassified Candidatus Accumulibacter]EXI88542.1 MAG: Stalked cell differentiation-controlling protein [Candidatus Accumulibacter regalis]MQM32888.1 sensor domain-containing diguanylate cyclase [Candidatus Accumulibacter phosphatis]MBL8369169.1 diguanylate cyclase [Accumulibacter sp.]MBN8514921.1 diguanylate cyclase [Accumulibacter sp.]HRE71931.1 diguanylate cyclase [Accumulibacter sp.]
MKFLQILSLRQMLTLPYVVLVLVLAAAIGGLSYSAGRVAVDTLSNQLLSEMVYRIAQAAERHVFGASAVLETAFPAGVAAPEDINDDLDNLRTRFWLATSVHRDPNNYAYYGDRSGRFFGLWRHSENDAELRLRTVGDGPRTIYRFSGIAGELTDPVRETRIFEPRERPWFKSGESSTAHTWTSVYIDFKTEELVATRARRVNNAQGEFQGVVATDLSLQGVNDFLHSLRLSANGIAYVVETDGQLIGTSRGPHLRKDAAGDKVRLKVQDSDDSLVAASYREIRKLLHPSAGAPHPQTAVFESADGEAVEAAYARIQDAAGLDWIIVVAVPRSDFLFGVTENFKRTVALALLASLMTILIGFMVLSVVARDLKQLAVAARKVGNGDLNAAFDVTRSDEIGDLAKSFRSMQSKLLSDRLTGLANREAFLRRVDERLAQQRELSDPRPFAILFIDLNDFKNINDSFGHDVGDKVLQEMAQRMLTGLRSRDLVARYAGDEFVVMLDAVNNRHDAESARTNIEQLLGTPLLSIDPAASDANTGASIGLAMYPDDGQDVESLVQYSDADMYRRKQALQSDRDGPSTPST